MWGREDLAARLQFQWELDLRMLLSFPETPSGGFDLGAGAGGCSDSWVRGAAGK